MIIECPNCGTKYAVREEAIKPRGRTVRCSTCGQQWHADGAPPVITAATDERIPETGEFAAVDEPGSESEPDPAEPQEAVEDHTEAEVQAAAHEPEPIDMPFVAVPQLRTEQEDSKASKWPSFAVLAASIMLLVGGVALGKNSLVKLWPASERLYRVVGLQGMAPGEGLELHDVHALLDTDPKGKGLTIEAVVANTLSVNRDLPMMEASLLPDSGSGHKWTFSAGSSQVPPLGTADVKMSFEAAGTENGKVLLTFSSENTRGSR